MYFSRDVKNKITIDTYVQRARMFGSRGNIFKDFELAIPRSLYDDWWTAFYNHRGSLVTVNNFSSPIWISDSRTQTTAPSSIKKASVDESRGEIGFQVFDYNDEIKNLYENCQNDNKSIGDIEKLAECVGDDALRDFFVKQLVRKMKVNPKKVAFQNIRLINKLSNTDHDTFIRKRGGLIDQVSSNPNYQLALYENNETKKARIFFKCSLSKKYLQRIK
jgi:hypothetical protein